MKRLALAFVAAFVSAAQAQEAPRQFNLECRDVKTQGALEEDVSLVISVDLERGLSCRQWNNSCFVKPLVERGRWIDLSYRFRSRAGQDYEMSRLFDRDSGWLDQVVRRAGHHGSPYGDAVCSVTAYTPFADNRPADAPADVR